MELPSFTHLAPWHWWVLGAALLILEVFAPGVFFVWLGLAALVVGLLLTVLPLPVAVQLLLFAALSVLSIFLGRRLLARLPRSAEADSINQGASRLIGRTVVLTEPIVNGQGRARIGDGYWTVRGPDAPAGSTVQIMAAEGTTLMVHHAHGQSRTL
jgi:inner membrane protein